MHSTVSFFRSLLLKIVFIHIYVSFILLYSYYASLCRLTYCVARFFYELQIFFANFFTKELPKRNRQKG